LLIADRATVAPCHAGGIVILRRIFAGVLVLAAACSSRSTPMGKQTLVSQQSPARPLRIRVEDMQGRVHDLDATLAQGKPVVLVFWQTWCRSCLREAPEISEAAQRHGDALLFLGVVSGPEEAVDDRRVTELVERFDMDYPQIRDRDLRLTKQLGVAGTPTIVVLGTDGSVVYKEHRPPSDWRAFAGAAHR
jgi:thiol-disulfide isomerase/thioredoxin